jgi:hypothetical protein
VKESVARTFLQLEYKLTRPERRDKTDSLHFLQVVMSAEASKSLDLEMSLLTPSP